jgi:hypothetical protein
MCDLLLLLEYGRKIYFSVRDLVVQVVNINLAISLGTQAGFSKIIIIIFSQT